MECMVYFLVHVVCGILAAGISFAQLQAICQSRRRQDLSYSYFIGLLFGPAALLVVFFISGFAEHGIKLK